MIKFLTFLCLSVGCTFSCFSSTINNESDELARLNLQATDYFEAGDLENERLKRIEILALKQGFETLRVALQSCAVCEKFEAGKYLLKSFSHSLKASEIKTLRENFQNMEVRIMRNKKALKAEEQEEIPDFKEDVKGQDVISSDVQVKLNLLRLLAREYFRKGDHEQELAKLIEIAHIKRDLPSLKQAIEQCAVCLKFKKGNILLDTKSHYFPSAEIQILRTYLQDRENKYNQRHRILVVPSEKR